MSSMRQDADFWCVEMAIGNMRLNTEIVRPHIAVVTNIAPAHLKYHNNLENIAHRKARIFEGMPVGAKAVLFKDMAFYEVFYEAAKKAGIHTVSFGANKTADIALLELDSKKMEFVFFGQKHRIQSPSLDIRDIYNFLATLGVLKSLSLKVNLSNKQFYQFASISGRNQQLSVKNNGHEFLLIDDAYNANPLSMGMALKSLKNNHKKSYLY